MSARSIPLYGIKKKITTDACELFLKRKRADMNGISAYVPTAFPRRIFRKDLFSFQKATNSWFEKLRTFFRQNFRRKIRQTKIRKAAPQTWGIFYFRCWKPSRFFPRFQVLPDCLSVAKSAPPRHRRDVSLPSFPLARQD